MTLKTNGSLLRWLLGTGTVGFGAVVALGLVKAIEAKPEMAWKVLDGWGPLFAILVLGMVFGYQRSGEFIREVRNTAVSMQGVRDAMKQIADKDDNRIIQLRNLVAFCARTTEANSKALSRIEKGMVNGQRQNP